METVEYSRFSDEYEVNINDGNVVGVRSILGSGTMYTERNDATGVSQPINGLYNVSNNVSSNSTFFKTKITNTECGPVYVEELDWNSFDNKDSPQNWPKWKKWYVTCSVALICLCITLGSSLYVAGVSELVEALEHHSTLYFWLNVLFGWISI